MSGWQRAVERFLIMFMIGIFVVALAYTAFVLTWSFSDGDRVGYLQKFSRKGWLCKTYEGELAMTTVPGLAPVLWNFTVRDDAVAAQLNTVLGRRVVLHYKEHRGIPTDCFGETGYFVDRIDIMPDGP
ncbi:MAG TPA: hypothetical protein VFA38_09770 [Nitrospirales bacterium]|nr:hypothetical protein [Nitrospirales bacterium]